MFGNDGNDVLYGNGGDDYVDGENDDDDLHGGPGNDSMHGRGGNDVVLGNEGDDFITGDRGNDTINGGPGNDQINGNLDDDVIAGEEGDDRIHAVGGGFDRISCGDGFDVVFADVRRRRSPATARTSATEGGRRSPAPRQLGAQRDDAQIVGQRPTGEGLSGADQPVGRLRGCRVLQLAQEQADALMAQRGQLPAAGRASLSPSVYIEDPDSGGCRARRRSLPGRGRCPAEG